MHAAKALAPLRQGDLDGLCGVYSVINAARLVLWPDHELSYAQLRAVFAAAVADLARSKRLRDNLGTGVLPAPLLRLSRAAAATIKELTGAQLRLTLVPKLFDRAALLRAIKCQLRAGNPLIVGLEGKHEHWTVVVGYSDTRLTLFDCSDLRWIALAGIAHADARAAQPHGIDADGVIAVQLRQPDARRLQLAAPRRRRRP